MWQKLCAASEVVEGNIHGVRCGDLPLIVLKRDTYSCFYDQCSHQDVKMSDFGTIQDGELVCFAHGAKFCAKSGEATCAPATEGLKSYPIKEEDGFLFVQLQEVNPMPKNKPNLWKALRLRCPYCGIEKLQKKGSWFQFREGCTTCGYRYERELGYYSGASWMINFPVTGLLGFFLVVALVMWTPLTATPLAILTSVFVLSFCLGFSL